MDPNVSIISPLLIDIYCNNNTETALHAAVKGKYYEIAAALLQAGSNPNAIIKSYMDVNETLSCLSIDEESTYGQSTALVEACRNRDAAMVDLLLNYGVRDDDCKALAVVVNNHDEILTAKLLAMKVRLLKMVFYCVSISLIIVLIFLKSREPCSLIHFFIYPMI